MIIAQLAPLEESVPPQKYGGTELVVYNLTQELANMGHKVYLLATGDSQLPKFLNKKGNIVFIKVFRKSLRKALATKSQPMREVFKYITNGKVLEKLSSIKVDIVHNHIGWRLLPFAYSIKSPLVTTLHGALDQDHQRIIHGNFSNLNYVSISFNQRKPFPKINYVGNVYNGIDVKKFMFSEKKGNYFAFLGRTSPEKGIVEAIEATKMAGATLKIAAKVDEADKLYFKKFVEPLIDGKRIEFLGEVNFKEKVEFLKNSAGLVAPIQWEEPFGLYFIEAMACGVPVIAFNRGSASEVIKDNITGFLPKRNDVSLIAECIRKIRDMPEKMYAAMSVACRNHVDTHFTSEKMAQEYEKIYQKLLGASNTSNNGSIT